jgi:hypothetical protein
VITASKPVVRTQDVIRTETVPIWNGVTTINSTITRMKGTTVVTETEYGTQTIAAPLNPLFPGQQYAIVSSPVVTEVTTTSTALRIYPPFTLRRRICISPRLFSPLFCSLSHEMLSSVSGDVDRCQPGFDFARL